MRDSTSITTSTATFRGPVAYLCLCKFWINSEEEYRSTMEKHGKELMADLPNFTNIEPVVQIDELLLGSQVRAAA
jgi:hypothetical protein